MNTSKYKRHLLSKLIAKAQHDLMDEIWYLLPRKDDFPSAVIVSKDVTWQLYFARKRQLEDMDDKLKLDTSR